MRHFHNDDYGQRWAIAAALYDGGKNKQEIVNHFAALARRFGMFFSPMSMGHEKALSFIDRNLKAMAEDQWILFDEERSMFALTEKGRDQAETMLNELSVTREKVVRALQPAVVTKITFFVHIVLGAVKLPAALVSGSVALLNDALDTLLDAFSAILVHIGIRIEKERFAGNAVLFFMVLTGAYALYESISRFLSGSDIRPEPLAYIAILISAAVSLVLWLYQRTAGLAAGSLAIIAQSVDSRNHLLVAGGVGVSLAASYAGVPVIDLIVGVGIAVMILKGAWDLFTDMRAQAHDGEIDLSDYDFQFFEKSRAKQMRRWFLYEIDRGNIVTREQLFKEAELSADFHGVAQLKAIGLAGSTGTKKAALDTVTCLFPCDLVAEDETGALSLTDKGVSDLERGLKHVTAWSSRMGSDRKPPAKVFHALCRAGLFTGIWLAGRHVNIIEAGRIWQDHPYVFNITGLPVAAAEGFFVLVCTAMFVFGSMQVMSARRFMRVSQRFGRTVILHGPYSSKRHPLYSGMMVCWIAAGAALGSPYTMGAALVLSAGQAAIGLAEEKKLRAECGKEWLDFTAKVKTRFFPLWEGLAVLLVTSVWFLYWQVL